MAESFVAVGDGLSETRNRTNGFQIHDCLSVADDGLHPDYPNVLRLSKPLAWGAISGTRTQTPEERGPRSNLYTNPLRAVQEIIVEHLIPGGRQDVVEPVLPLKVPRGLGLLSIFETR